MAVSNVEINVKSNLLKIADDLRKIAEVSRSSMQALDPFVKKTGDVIEKQTTTSLNGLQRLRNMASSVGKKMAEDFKSMFAAFGISQGLKLGGIFGTSVKETFELNDQIRKLSSVFGIAQSRFSEFQNSLVKGLGEIGLSSDSATMSLKGLAETQVRGEAALVEYSKLAGQLASIFQQHGEEGAIAKGIAGVLTEQGKNPSDVSQARQVAEDVRKGASATGLKPTELLDGMQSIFREMSYDLKKNISTSGLINLAVIQRVGGENSAKFIHQYLEKSPIARKFLEAHKMGNIFTEKGLDVEKFRAGMKALFKNIPQDMKLAAQTLGVDEETASGLIQLYQALDKVDQAQKKIQSDTKALTTVYYDSMGALEAFTASLNKFKSSLSEQVSGATNWITDALKKGFQSGLSDIAKALLPEGAARKAEELEKKLPDALGKNLGSTATVIAGAGLTSLLVGGGINGLMNMLKGKAGGLVEKKAAEELLGVKANPVYVVNADELASKTGTAVGSSPLSGALGNIAKAMSVLAVGAVAYEAAPELNRFIKENQPEWMNKSDQVIDGFLEKLANFLFQKQEVNVRFTVPGNSMAMPTEQPSFFNGAQPRQPGLGVRSYINEPNRGAASR